MTLEICASYALLNYWPVVAPQVDTRENFIRTFFRCLPNHLDMYTFSLFCTEHLYLPAPVTEIHSTVLQFSYDMELFFGTVIEIWQKLPILQWFRISGDSTCTESLCIFTSYCFYFQFIKVLLDTFF